MKHFLFILGILIIAFSFESCGGSYESENRDELISTFEDDFGFQPPNSVEKIKLKNWGIYDTDVHWLAFTYDFSVLKKIIAHDSLNIALNNTSEFNEITESIKKDAHNPKWLELPDSNTKQIYYKKDFIEAKSFSEYYLLGKYKKWNNISLCSFILLIKYYS